MVVLNKAGGGGAVGTQFVANAEPDGYTLLYALNTVSEMPHIDTLLGRPLSFKKEQLIPIGQITVTPFAIMVNAESPWKTFPEFVAAAKQKPEAFQYAWAGVYSTTHIMWERMLLATGLKVRHMPTTGGGPIMTAVLWQTRRHWTLRGANGLQSAGGGWQNPASRGHLRRAPSGLP